MSDTALIDSAKPIWSPAFTSVFCSGSSMNTTSPRLFCAWSVMPIVATFASVSYTIHSCSAVKRFLSSAATELVWKKRAVARRGTARAADARGAARMAVATADMHEVRSGAIMVAGTR